MMEVTFAYDHRTSVVTSLNGSALDFAANLRRLPVAFRGRVKEPVLMRQLMTALHEVILGDFRTRLSWWQLDPVITVHPNQLFFEAFSTDESVYVRLSAPFEAFEVQGEVTYGTTNIDFTFGLRVALQMLRSSRRTEFTVGAAGFGVETASGAVPTAHFEEKVTLPETWVKGFMQVQSALTMRPFTFDVRPVDLLTVISYFVDNNARKPPRGMRYQFTPGEPISVFLEPWNEQFVFKGTQYDGHERTVRVWGRKRLELLFRVLPYAQRVTVGLLGRGLPHFYICHCGDYQFTLVLSGWVFSDWAGGSAFDLLVPQTSVDAEQIAAVYNYMAQHLITPQQEIAAHTLLEIEQVEAALFHLCRAGRVIYDPTTRQYRSRELFAQPIDVDTLFTPDPRIDQARARVESGAVTVKRVFPSDTRPNEIKALCNVRSGDAVYDVLVAVDRDGHIRFAQCQCQFFQDNIMSRGPCEHILAARFAADEELRRVEQEIIMSG